MDIVTCPKCFSKHPISELTWGCANSDCNREAIPTTNKDGNNLHPTCEGCGQAMTMRFCPDCGFQILIGEESAKTIPLSIVGSEGVGKSHYLTVLINEIRHSVGRAYRCSLYPLGGDDTISQYESLYYKPLYEQRLCIPSTDQDDVSPLVYSLVFDNQEKGNNCSLTFYDACGANFRSERVMADYNRSVYNSEGIILMVDPSQIPSIREEYIAQGKPVLEDDLSSLLARTIQLIRGGSKQQDLKKKITIPIAVCISKLDTIRHKLDPSSFLQYPSRHLQFGEFDVTDHSCCDKELKSLMNAWGNQDLVNQVKSQFEHCGFFAFSALGNSPSNDNTITHIAPFRVYDPFLWILAKNKIIRAKRHTVEK